MGMTQHGKKVRVAREGIDRTKLYPLTDAVTMVKERAKAKFDETIEIAMNLGVDPRHADQMVRGVVNLPNGTGRTQRRFCLLHLRLCLLDLGLRLLYLRLRLLHLRLRLRDTCTRRRLLT